MLGFIVCFECGIKAVNTFTGLLCFGSLLSITIFVVASIDSLDLGCDDCSTVAAASAGTACCEEALATD